LTWAVVVGTVDAEVRVDAPRTETTAEADTVAVATVAKATVLLTAS
jgi:hypothetical protein